MSEYIRKTVESPQGAALSVHMVSSVRVTRGINQEPAFLAVVHSWPAVAGMVAGAAPLHSLTLRLEPTPGLALAGNLFAAVTSLLLTTTDGPLFGGLLESVDLGAVSLEAAKEQKRREINSARLAANRTTFEFQGKAIACDELSRSDIDGVNGAVALTGSLPAGFPLAWKATDNSFVPIPSAAVWTQFYQAMVAQGAANFARSEARKAAIEAAATLAALQSIVW